MEGNSCIVVAKQNVQRTHSRNVKNVHGPDCFYGLLIHVKISDEKLTVD